MQIKKRHHWALLALGVAILALTGCATSSGQISSQDTAPSATDTPSSPGTPPSTGAPFPSAPPTSPSVATTTTLVLKTPAAAAAHLYDAWKTNDRPTALRAATTAAVDALFAKAWAADTYFFGGCTTTTAPSECDYNYAAGVVKMQISGTPSAGFRVDSVSLGSAS